MNRAASEVAFSGQLKPHAEVDWQCTLAFTQDDRPLKELKLVDQSCTHSMQQALIRKSYVGSFFYPPDRI